MNEDFEPYGNVEETLARLVAGFSPESYERYAPVLQELGLALAERRVALREVNRAREAREDLEALYERVREGYEGVLEALDRAMEDLERAEERMQNALRLLEDAE